MKIKRKKKACPEQGRRVIIAMSGGIDSSVAAALLKKDGYEVVGVFMKFWSETGKDKPFGAAQGWPENSCCALESEKRARAVAKILKIPFYIFNFEKEFKKKVVDYFLKEHEAGRTPNPCVVCNKEIKFGLLLEKALALGADFVATGHYARKIRNPTLRQTQGRPERNRGTKSLPRRQAGEVLNCEYKLLKGKDVDKDQSYFLWQLSQKQLRRVLLPMGNYTKPETRKLAKKFRLPVLDIPESQEICFAPFGANEFIVNHLEQKSGKILDKKGSFLGEHSGLAFYTIGQRKGINLSGGPALSKDSAGRPYYVLDKDFKKNVLIVTKDEKDLYKKDLKARDVNWISNKAPKLPLKANVKIRYRQKPAKAVIGFNSKFKVHSLRFKVLQRAVTPGQSAVFYKGQELLGGGIIK